MDDHPGNRFQKKTPTCTNSSFLLSLELVVKCLPSSKFFFLFVMSNFDQPITRKVIWNIQNSQNKIEYNFPFHPFVYIYKL